MASKHLKKVDTAAKGSHETAPRGSHEAAPAKDRASKAEKAPKEPKKAKKAAPPASSREPKKAKKTGEAKPAKEPEKAKKADSAEPAKEPRGPRLVKRQKELSEAEAAAEGKRARLDVQGKKKGESAAPRHDASSGQGEKAVSFRRERVKEEPLREEGGAFSQRDAVGAIIALVAAVVLLAATVVVYVYRDSFSPDGMILSVDTASTPEDEYIFDAGSGQAFAAAGRGLAVANASGLELLDGDGTAVTSKLMQMENPTAAGCEDFAVFYDLGGTKMAVARFDGTVEELAVAGDIISATVSESGYIAVTTEYTGRRALVTVYDPTLSEVYQWYSSSAWVLSAHVSPDGQKMAVLSYTVSGSEVRFFDLTREDSQGTFFVADTVLLDVHWFSADRLCALSGEQVFFFNAQGEWQNTYAFAGQYLVGYTFDGSNCAAFALSPYRAGTTATLVSLDPTGMELGTAEVDSGIVCLTASDLEIMVLCSDGAILYNSSLSEKGRLTGLPGFKYALLRSRGEALLIASNYAEVYTF